MWSVRSRRVTGSALRLSHVDRLAFSPDGRLLAAAAPGSIRLWDWRARKLVGVRASGQEGSSEIEMSRPGSMALAFNRLGNVLASARADGTVRLWDTRSRSLARIRIPARTRSDALSHDGRIVAFGGRDGRIRLQDVRTHRSLDGPLIKQRFPIDRVAFSPGGHLVASLSRGVMRLWDARTYAPVDLPPTADNGRVDGVAFSADGGVLAIHTSSTIRVWDVRTRTLVAAPASSRTTLDSTMALGPDGHVLAFSGANGTLRLWDLRRPRDVALTGGRGAFYTLAFSPDGSTVAAARIDGIIRLWDVHKGKPLGAPLNRHAGGIAALAFSPDGRLLAAGADDGTISLWDLRTRKPLGAPIPGSQSIVHVAFSSDGRSLTSIDVVGTIRVWDKVLWHDDAQLRSEVCHVAGNALSRSEWARYAGAISYRHGCP